MSEMIERVARALAKADGDQAVLFDYYLEHARAAIEAMRDPTTKMILEGQDAAGTQNSVAVWDAMMNAALSR